MKSVNALQDMIIGLVNECKLRNKNHKKVTEQEVVKRNSFIESLEDTFWVVSPDYEKKLKDSGHEDWYYLEGVRGKKRCAAIGSFETNSHKKMKRAILEKQSIENRRKKDLENPFGVTSSSTLGSKSTSSASTDNDGLDYIPPKKKTKKMEALPRELLLLTEKTQTSVRNVTQIASAFVKQQGENINDYNLSCATTHRRMTSMRKTTADEIIQDQLSNKDMIWTLHWDGKKIESLRHAGKDTENLAVLLTGTDGQEVLLSVSEVQDEANAENESQHIMKILMDYNVRISNIAALVFDTTSLNTGNKQGIVLRLETQFGRSLLQLGCRHHIYELVCGASCSVVYGSGTGPTEPLFKKLKDIWDSLDKQSYSSIEIPRSQRKLLLLVEQVVTFLQDWISNSSKIKLRHDYLELATLTLLFLGGTLPESIKNATIKDPGAIHHARWMSKAIYTMKIALFRNQLEEIYEEDLDNIVSLAIFLSVFYTKAWLTCTDAAAAPSNDLELFKLLLNVENNVLKNPKSWPSHFYSLVSNARKKLENHLWYLSERLVIFSLFSEQVPVSEKKKMTAALLDYTPTTNSAQSMPQSKNFGSKILKDLIGHDSWTMFK